jgi:hypothetical protein
MTARLQHAISGGRKTQLGLLLGAMLAAALLVPSGLTALAGVSPPVQTFVDVPPSHPFYEDIEWMAAEGISEGYEPGPEYRPSIAVSRAAMSAFMYRLAESPPFASPGTPTFADVGTGHPFYDEIEWMADTGITTGFPTSPPTYQPGAAVSRQSMSAFMYRLAGEPTFSAPGSPTFTDVGTGHPFYDEIEWMADTEISEGYTPGPEYRPSIAVSRQAMSAFMYRLATGPGVDI